MSISIDTLTNLKLINLLNNRSAIKLHCVKKMKIGQSGEYQNNILAYRNSNGTFVKGNPGGPGRPTIQQLKERRKKILAEQLAYEEYMLSQQPPEIRELIEKAMNGDVSAIKKVWHLF